MRRVATVLFVVVGLVLVSLSATASFADDRLVDEKRIQVWMKGDTKKELDITDLDDEGFERLHKQMRAEGYTLTETRELKAYADGRVESKVRKHDTKNPLALGKPDYEPSIRRDLRELIRRGGTFPDDFRPHGVDDSLPPWWNFGSRGDAPRPPGVEAPEPGRRPEMVRGLMRASGRLVLRYLEVKDDPVRGPVYERALKDVGDALVEASEGSAMGIGRLAMRLMPRVIQGLGDPEEGPVFREIMEIVTGDLGEPPARPVVPEPMPRPATGPTVGGATTSLVPDGDRLVPQIGRVPEDSLAAQMTLEPGDRILEVDGRPVDPTGLARIGERIAKGGQLTLRVRRRTGETEVLDLEFAREGAR